MDMLRTCGTGFSRLFVRALGAALIVLLSAAATARAQQWALDMFDHTEHDFGTVARGAKVEHRFTFQNIYLEDAHVASARVSCGCTTPEVPAQVLKTWDKAAVVAKVDTRSFLGQKDVTITVVFDKPFPAEVQLHIHCYIRSDVVVQPGAVQFGAVPAGAVARQRVGISYAGRDDWRIVGVECSNPNLSAQAIQTARGGGQVNYSLVVTLAAGAPAGYLRDELYLVTNDANPRAMRVPVPVEGMVRAAVTAHPSPLYLGTVTPGESAVRQLVISGSAPFRILQVESTDPRFHCVPDGVVSTLHRLPVAFHAGQTEGKASGRIFIRTDASAVPVEVAVQADVMLTTDSDAVEAAAPPPPPQPPVTTARPSLGVGREL